MSTTSLFTPQEQHLLDLTLDTRVKIITSLTLNDSLPTDKDNQSFLVKALDGLDRTLLTAVRCRNEKEANMGQEETNNLITEMLRNISDKHPGINHRTEIPVLDNSIPIDKVIDNEMSLGIVDITYEDFMKRFPS